MKRQKNKLMVVGMVLATAMVMGANAGVISVSMDNNSAGPGLMESTDLAGASGVRVGNWNPWLKDDLAFGDAGQTVVDDSGATIAGFSATVNSAATASRDNNTVNDQAMFSDVWDVSTARTISASGVPYALYDVYVYMRDDGTARAGSFAIGSTTKYARGGAGIPLSDGTVYILSTDTTLGAGTDIDQGNYVKFSGLTGSSFDLVLTGIAAGDLARNKVAGFQIVQIPEPATIGLIAMVGVGLLAVRRFRM